jgi:hypothetical protein
MLLQYDGKGYARHAKRAEREVIPAPPLPIC